MKRCASARTPGVTALLEGGDELLQEQRVVALDRAHQEVLGRGRVLAVPDVEEHLLAGLEEAVGVARPACPRVTSHLSLVERDRPLLVVVEREVERPRRLDRALLEHRGQLLEDLGDFRWHRPYLLARRVAARLRCYHRPLLATLRGGEDDDELSQLRQGRWRPARASAPSCGAGGRRARAGHAGRPRSTSSGDVMQAVVVPLGAGQEIQAEPGALLYMAGDVEMDSSMKGGLWGGLKRMVGGREPVHDPLPQPRRRARWPSPPRTPASSSRSTSPAARDWLCQRDSFLCATAGIEMGIAFTKQLRGRALRRRGLHPAAHRRATAPRSSTAAATSSSSTSSPGQTLRVDTGCIVAFEETVQLRHPVRGRLQERAVRRGGAVPGHPAGPGQVHPADAAVLAPGRPHHGHDARRHGRRRRVGGTAARHRQHLRRRTSEDSGQRDGPGRRWPVRTHWSPDDRRRCRCCSWPTSSPR